MPSSLTARLMSTLSCLPLSRWVQVILDEGRDEEVGMVVAVLHPQRGDEGHDEAGRALDLVGVELAQAVRPLVDEPLDEGETVVLRVHPNVRKGRFAIDEAREVGRLPIGPAAPCSSA